MLPDPSIRTVTGFAAATAGVLISFKVRLRKIAAGDSLKQLGLCCLVGFDFLSSLRWRS